MISEEELTEIEERCNAASPVYHKPSGYHKPRTINAHEATFYDVFDKVEVGCVVLRVYANAEPARQTAQFHANAQTDVQSLIAEVREQRATIERMTQAYAALHARLTAEEPAPDTFFARYLRGELVENDIHDYISTWHKSMGMTPLHEYLGMTWEQYSTWVQTAHLLDEPSENPNAREEHADRLEAMREPLDVLRYGGIDCGDIV